MPGKCKILLSINPEHVENILNGSKLFEFRKIRCKNNVDKIIIYATFPVMRVVAEVKYILLFFKFIFIVIFYKLFLWKKPAW